MTPCATCREPVLALYPCPCGLGAECPVVVGVCGACHEIIARNAMGRIVDPSRVLAAAS